MLFNSVDFAVFLPLAFFLYWFVSNKKLSLQNLLIVVLSYFFYCWWDWRFLSLIIFSTVTDYIIGLALFSEKNTRKRSALLWTSISVNLIFLFFFKYFNFFLDNFVAAFSFFGQEISMSSLNIILPVGISFYTFQTMSYTIDVYKRKLNPTKDFIAFSAFVSFFPQLMAGPIERATNLLPQFYHKRTFNYSQAIDGLRQMLWGFFMKIVIADNCAVYANEIFNNSSDYNGSTLVLGALFFTFQIYGDFAGYSNIAIGTAKLLGFNLMQNFAFPYFSRDIAEFWRRWHISLSTWFRDYLYIPLGGSRGGTSMKIRNTFIIFIVSGFWHGANWTFIVWGALNALFFLPLLLTSNNRKYLGDISQDKHFPSLKEIQQIGFTFTLTVFAWIFFRAENLQHAFSYISEIFSASLFALPNYGFNNRVLILIFVIFGFMFVEWIGRHNKHALETLFVTKPKMIRWMLYAAICLIIIVLGGSQEEFIYFQF